MQFLIRLMGIFGMAGALTSFQCKTHKRILMFSTMSELAFCLQYILLGTFTGAALNLLGCIRKVVFARRVEQGKDNRKAIGLFSTLFVIAGILTWQGPISLLIIAAKCVTTIAYGSKRPFVIRALNLCTNLSWMGYDWLATSYEGVISDAFSVVSIVIGILRLDIPEWKERRKNKKPMCR